MANKYYVISGNPEITQKNRNRFYLKKYLDDLYVIEENRHSSIWLKDKTFTEKTLTEANEIITNRNTALTDQRAATVTEEESTIGADHDTDASIPPVELQDLITE
jgi:hypothetical protein|tara:strand:+ start:271 stop:585 length:315 start_codon:yes stop_codon:yes gene_type:complete